MGIIGWMAWWGAWALITLPWGASETTAQWHRVEWVPFQFGMLRDAVLNFFFFVPFGMLAVRGRRAGRAVAAAAAVSTATETIQLYGIGRFPSATDVVVNTAGAAAGVALPRLWPRRLNAAAARSSRDPIPPSAPSRPH
jgi:glycopeptide antibiotics resistance protein